MYYQVATVMENSASDAAVLDAASAIFASRDILFHLLVPLLLPDPVLGSLAQLPDPLFAAHVDQERLSAGARALELEHQLAARGVKGRVDLIEGVGMDESRLLAAAARRHDMTILAAPGNDLDQAVRRHAYFFSLLKLSGRPVMVIPAQASCRPQAALHVVIAWSDTPHSVRAVHDALPLLRKASRVDILAVNPSPGEEQGETGAAEMVVVLARHGVEAAYHQRYGEVADTILKHVTDASCNVIVAGGYGHSRWHEWALGGTTRTLKFNS